MPIVLNIDVTRIPKDRIQTKPEWKGKFLKLVLVDKPSDKGDDGFIAIDVTREEREAGTRGEIVGNWRHLGPKPGGGQRAPTPARSAARPVAARPDPDPDLDASEQIPF